MASPKLVTPPPPNIQAKQPMRLTARVALFTAAPQDGFINGMKVNGTKAYLKSKIILKKKNTEMIYVKRKKICFLSPCTTYFSEHCSLQCWNKKDMQWKTHIKYKWKKQWTSAQSLNTCSGVWNTDSCKKTREKILFTVKMWKQTKSCQLVSGRRLLLFQWFFTVAIVIIII